MNASRQFTNPNTSRAASQEARGQTPSIQRLGNQGLQRMLLSRRLQARMQVSQPGDRYELEADRIADQVMRTPVPPHASNAAAKIMQRTCNSCEADELQRSAAGAESAPAGLESGLTGLAGRGEPLHGALRSYMEPRFGTDFSAVRVHTDSHAQSLARAVNAQAFTVGRDVVFGAGYYNPEVDSGRRLLAHELTHVVQQGFATDLEGRQQLQAFAKDHRTDVVPRSPLLLQRDPLPPAAAAAVCPSELDARAKQAIIEGEYAERGKYSLQTQTRTIKETVSVWKGGTKVPTEVEREETTIDSTFSDPALCSAKRYLDEHWSGSIDMNKATGGSGDTKGKRIDMPNWVYEYQNKLAAQKPRDYVAKAWEKGNNPNWNEDSFLAQRVLEAFLRAWHRQQLPSEKSIPSNIQELYKRSGASEKAYGNAQATLLGDPNVYGWCGPASYNAVVLGLLRNGLRFDTGKQAVTAASIEARSKQQAQFIRNSIKWKYKDISEEALNARYAAELSRMAFLEEVGLQAAFFIANNTSKQKGWLQGDRFVAGERAYAEYQLQPGDVITQALMNGSPVSGHVLTVIREERDPAFNGETGTAVSTIYGISGNAGSIGGGSVRSEKFTREMPPATLKQDLGAMSSLGNRMTVAVDARKTAENAEAAKLAKEANVPVHKVPKADIASAAAVAQAERRVTLQKSLDTAQADFQRLAGMPYGDYVRAKASKTPPAAIYVIGRTHRASIEQIVRLQAQIRAIDDYTNVPVEAKGRVAYSTSDPFYNERSGKTGRFRPEKIGHMWITTIIKAGQYANAEKINADLNATAEEREKKIAERNWGPDLSAADYEKKTLERYGMVRLPSSVESLWPGAVASIEGGGLPKDYD